MIGKLLISRKTVKSLAWAGLQSGTVMLVADISTQTFLEGRQSSKNKSWPASIGNDYYYDPQRTIRWTIAGMFLHGPYFYMAFWQLDKFFGNARSMRTVLAKTFVGQVLAFPPYLVLLFSYLAIAEGKPSVVGHIQEKFPHAFVGGCIFWPIANIVNFRYIPGYGRVAYVAIVGSCWNAFLNWHNSHKNAFPKALSGWWPGSV